MRRALAIAALLLLVGCADTPDRPREQLQRARVAVASNPAGLPLITNTITWLGAPNGLSHLSPDVGAYTSNALATLHPGWVRGTFDYRPTNLTNYDSFNWSRVQPAGSNSFDWSGADAEVRDLTNRFPAGTKVIVVVNQGAYITNNCPNSPCSLENDPPWTAALTMQQYAQAKARYINALAARYTNSAWARANLARNVIWGIEVENETHPPYDRLALILSHAQPARATCKLIGWTCWGPLAKNWMAFVNAAPTNLYDAVSWHLYTHQVQPPDRDVGSDINQTGYGRNDPSFVGRLDQWESWLQSQLPAGMPILVDELGLQPEVPMRMAKALIMLRATGAAMCQLFNWQSGNPPGEDQAYNALPNRAYPHARVAAWTAYWLGNATRTSSTVDGNAFVYTFSNGRSFAWSREGTTRACAVSNHARVTDIYGNTLATCTNLTADPVVLTGGTITFH